MSIPKMISHLTCRPAKRLLVYPHRGVIRVGSAADLVLFDPLRIKGRSDVCEVEAICDWYILGPGQWTSGDARWCPVWREVRQSIREERSFGIVVELIVDRWNDP